MSRSKPGRGRTTVLKDLHAALGGAFVTIQDFVDALLKRHPLAMEEAYFELLLAALQQHDTVIVDDLQLPTAIMKGCGFYLRSGLLDAPMTALASAVSSGGWQVVGEENGGEAEEGARKRRSSRRPRRWTGRRRTGRGQSERVVPLKRSGWVAICDIALCDCALRIAPVDLAL